MQFIYPYFLWGLMALAVPVIIHLFNFRKFKRIYFSNVQFLKQVQQETQSRNKLKQWLILAARLLAITCLVIAFAQPFIPGTLNISENVSQKSVTVFIDNSFSMDAQQKQGRLIDLARTYADEIISAYSDADRIQILTHDFESRHQVFYSPTEARQLVNQVSISSFSRPLSEVLMRISDLHKNQAVRSSRIYIISDFQHSFTDWQRLRMDSMLFIQFVPITPSIQSNLYIDSCWTDRPELQKGGTMKLMVRVRNESDENVDNLTLRFKVNGQQKSPVNVSVGARASVDVEINYTIQETGFHTGEISLDDDQITFDDLFYVGFDVKESLPIYHIEGAKAGPYIQRLFGNDTYFKLETVKEGQIDYTKLSLQPVILLNALEKISSGLIQELKKHVESGGTIVVIPSSNAELKSYNELFAALGTGTFQQLDTSNVRIERIDSGDPFYADVFEQFPENVDLPIVKKYWIISSQSSAYSIPLLNTKNGRRFYVRYQRAKGQVYVLASALDESWGNFSRHALFVPTFIKTVFSALQPSSLYYTIGTDEQIAVQGLKLQGDNVFTFKHEASGTEIIPQQRTIENTTWFYPGNLLSEDGLYTVLAGSEPVFRFVMNYSRRESNPNVYSVEQLNQQVKELGFTNISLMNTEVKDLRQAVMVADSGVKLWKLFIIFTLIFLGIEILLIRFMKG